MSKALSKPQQKVIDFLKANPEGYIVHDQEYKYGQMCRTTTSTKTSFFFTRQTFDALLKRGLIYEEGYMSRYLLNTRAHE